jgi:hypothetical protein
MGIFAEIPMIRPTFSNFSGVTYRISRREESWFLYCSNNFYCRSIKSLCQYLSQLVYANQTISLYYFYTWSIAKVKYEKIVKKIYNANH